LYRWSNWDIIKTSDPFNKVDSQAATLLAIVASIMAKT